MAVRLTNAQLKKAGKSGIPGSSKYRAVRTSCGEHMHASKKEALRCKELRLMEISGKIKALKQQPGFEIEVNGSLVCSYRADFSYYADGNWVVEDCKGMRTPVYRLKKKLMKANGIEILET